jgi:glycosyltransferase involved in cell wall biosynthesis
MRILHVVPSYLPAVRYGGPIFAVHGLCQALATRGHQVEVFTTNIDGSETSPVPVGKPVYMDGIHVHYFSSPLLRRLYWAPELGRALKRRVEEFDILHLHSVFLWPTWAAARAARTTGVPYVISPRGMLVQELIARRSRMAKLSWIQMIEKTNVQRASAVHLTSELEALELRRFCWQVSQCAVIPNAASEPLTQVSPASPDVEQLISQQPLILSLGRISWKKGLDRLLQAFATTRTGKLGIVGTDDEGLAPRLLDLARDLGVADRVHILPRTVEGSDKEHLFTAARLFVLSSYSENFGNSVVEAMRRGVPVVVSAEVGAAEIVEKSKGGLVAPGDARSLATAISQIIDDPASARMMGEAGQRYVRSNLTWTQIAIRMEKMYIAASNNLRGLG